MEDPTLHTYYAARAPDYDAIYAKPERQKDLRELEAWIPDLFRGKSVLEVACGTGYWTRLYAPEATRVVAVDAAQETLAIARARKGNETVRFLAGDAYALPESLGIFEAAFAGFWLSHVPNRDLCRFLTNLHARLESDASVVFIDNLYVEGSSTPIAETDADGNTYQLRTLRDGSTHRVLKNFPTQDDLFAMTDGLGVKARYRTFGYYWAFFYETAQPPSGDSLTARA